MNNSTAKVARYLGESGWDARPPSSNSMTRIEWCGWLTIANIDEEGKTVLQLLPSVNSGFET